MFSETPLTFRAPKKLSKRLRRRARMERQTVSALIRAALVAYLETEREVEDKDNEAKK